MLPRDTVSWPFSISCNALSFSLLSFQHVKNAQYIMSSSAQVLSVFINTIVVWLTEMVVTCLHSSWAHFCHFFISIICLYNYRSTMFSLPRSLGYMSSYFLSDFMNMTVLCLQSSEQTFGSFVSATVLLLSYLYTYKLTKDFDSRWLRGNWFDSDYKWI